MIVFSQYDPWLMRSVCLNIGHKRQLMDVHQGLLVWADLDGAVSGSAAEI